MQGLQNAAKSIYVEPQAEQKSIPAALGAVCQANEYLSIAVDNLVHRLQALVGSEAGEHAYPNEPDYSSELAQKLQNESRFVRAQAERIYSLLSRLEI